MDELIGIKRKLKRFFLPCIFLCLSAYIIIMAVQAADLEKRGHGGVLINEICLNNFSSLTDCLGGYTDWIELYNTSGKDVDLTGWRIRAGKNGAEWKLPGVVMGAGEFLLVHCSPEYEVFKGPGAEDTVSAADILMNGSGSGREGVVFEGRIYLGLDIPRDGTILVLKGGGGIVEDEVDVGKSAYDTSYARETDGSGIWGFREPTPGRPNSEGRELNAVQLKKPRLSKESGFYEEGFELEMYAAEGQRIYYTLDSSDPD